MGSTMQSIIIGKRLSENAPRAEQSFDASIMFLFLIIMLIILVDNARKWTAIIRVPIYTFDIFTLHTFMKCTHFLLGTFDSP